MYMYEANEKVKGEFDRKEDSPLKAKRKKNSQSTQRILGWILACLETPVNFCSSSFGDDHTTRICLQYLLNSK